MLQFQIYLLTVPSLVYRYTVRLMVPSDDCQFCLYQHLVYVVKLASQGYMFYLHNILVEMVILLSD